MDHTGAGARSRATVTALLVRFALCFGSALAGPGTALIAFEHNPAGLWWAQKPGEGSL